MKIFSFTSVAAYNKQLLSFYHGDANFVDNKTAIVSHLCGKSRFHSLCQAELYGVTPAGPPNQPPACIGALMRHRNYPGTLMLAFFECREGAQAEAQFFINFVRQKAAEYQCTRITASLDGHCDNSVGFLTSGGGRPCFGQSYNPLFYGDIFRQAGFEEIRLTSFYEEIAHLPLRHFKLGYRMLPKDVVFEKADFSRQGFKNTLREYTAFCNHVFAGQRFYFPREPQEDYELFASLRLFLDGDNLIFARKEGRLIGLLLWYPDFNELVPSGKGPGAGTLLKYRLLGQTPRAVKAVQIGVLPEYEASGLILALFGEFYHRAMGKHKGLTTCISSWILAENKRSVDLSSRILPKPYKTMSAFELTLE